MGVVSRNRPAMDSLCDEVFALILQKLPVPDVIRARAVCHRWDERMDAETAGRGYCPLAFQRFGEQHTCLGFDRATWKWESLPSSLSNVPRAIHLVPVAGNGPNGLLGFKVSQKFSEYIVGSLFSQKWTTLPKSTDSWGNAAMFMTTTQRDGFHVVAVRDGDTHIFKSESDNWTKVDCAPQSVQAHVVSCIRSKACAAVNNCLYTTDGNSLIAFDMSTEQWSVDRIHIPVSKNVMQVVGCAGSLFVVTEEEDSGRISVWDRGVDLQEFSLTVEMPQDIRGYLRPAVANARSRKLRSVGHGQMLFFWRRNSLIVVSFDLGTRGWRKLPEIVKPDIVMAGEPPEVTVDAVSLEPKYKTRPRKSTA